MKLSKNVTFQIDYPPKFVAKILLQGNPVNCDCSVSQILHFISSPSEISPAKQFLSLALAEDIKCAKPVELEGIQLKKLKYNSFKCRKKDLILSPSYFCQECDCWVRPSDDTVVIRCSNKYPIRLPESFIVHENYSKVELSLQSNNLTNFPKMNNEGYENVVLLDLYNNSISKIGPEIFSSNLQVKSDVYITFLKFKNCINEKKMNFLRDFF